jgi:ketol-acid reductoisomerase
MAKFISEDEISLTPIQNAKVAIIGFGNQGHAHALNLLDGGYQVCVGLRDSSKKHDAAREAGLEVKRIPDAVRWADWIMLCVPDQIMALLYEDNIKPYMRPGQTLFFAHGFAVVFEHIIPREDSDVVLVGPKGSGRSLRKEVLAGRGLASLVAVEQNVSGQALEKALAYAKAIGAARYRCLVTSFREETITDLFGEQVVLCGGIPELIKAAYETLTTAGYSPEAAYFECLHEAKLITDLIYERGLAGMRESISDTAEWGGYKSGPLVINKNSKRAMLDILERIENGEFAKRWEDETERNYRNLLAARNEEAGLGIEKVGAQIRLSVLADIAESRS